MSNTEDEKTPVVSGATTPSIAATAAAPAGVNTGQLSNRLRSLKRKEPNSNANAANRRTRYAKSKEEQVVWYEDPEKGEAIMEKTAKPATNTFAEPNLFQASSVSVIKGGRKSRKSRRRL